MTSERRPEPKASSTTYTEESRWLDAHAAEVQVHRGKWVAISGSAVVAVAPTSVEALEEATRKGATVPLLHFVGDPDLKRRYRIA